MKNITAFLFFVFSFNSSIAQMDSLKVIIFLSETCPICKNTTPELRKLYEDFSSKGVEFIGVFPSQNASNENTRNAFAEKYKLPFLLTGDSLHALTNQLSARITPEVFVINKKNNQLMYRGLVDNSYIRVGKRRSLTTEFYLRNAIEQSLIGNVEQIKSNEAVGCIIQK
jgi:thiol-disulfide isomerase/thioredoxin